MEKVRGLIEKNDELISLLSKLPDCDIRAVASLNALDVNNLQQNYFYMSLEEDFSDGELILRYYGLLQGLFVCIDSLYALSYAFTKSKSFININQNKKLRELKYIRNDIVGHPSNRVYSQRELAYCMLDTKKLDKRILTYTISFLNKNVESKSVSLVDMLEDYYIEANTILDTFLNVNKGEAKLSKIRRLPRTIFKQFYLNENYIDTVKKLREIYLSEFHTEDTNRHRLLWRISLIEKLYDIKSKNKLEKDLYHYAIAYEINKLITVVDEMEGKKTYKRTVNLPLPKYMIYFFRMLNTDKSLKQYIDNIYDADHPFFLEKLKALMAYSKKTNNIHCTNLLNLLLDAYYKDDNDYIYCIGVLLKKYKKNYQKTKKSKVKK